MDRRARAASRGRKRTQAVLPADTHRPRRPHRRGGPSRPARALGAGKNADGRRRMSRVYRAVLRLAPRRLRDAHGDDMAELFAERLTDARARGRVAAALVWTRAISD